VSGRIAVPPSKSLTQRALVAAAMAGGGARVVGPLDAEDPRLLYDALRTCGHDLVWEGGEIVATGRHGVAQASVSMANNGTGTRFLLAQLAALPGEWRVDGSPRLRERPLRPLVEALRRLGARLADSGGGLPLAVSGRPLAGGEVVVDAAVSSQFVSALLLLGARLPEGLTVRLPAPPASRPYLDLTADVLEGFGARVEDLGGATALRVRPVRLRPASYRVEGDWSAAAFPLCAAAAAGGRVEVLGVRSGSRQGDAVVLELLGRAGCQVETTDAGVALTGPARRPIEGDLRDAPDLFPALAAVAARRGGRLEGLATLRVKESDRLRVMTERLAAFGLAVRCGDAWFAAEPCAAGRAPASPSDPAADHRIAMALAVAGTFVQGVAVADAACVAKSWPTFWDDWAALTGAAG